MVRKKSLNTFSLAANILKLFEKAVKIKRQERGPEESREAKHAYCLLRWTGHVIRMPDKRPPKKESILWITTEGKALSRWPEEMLQKHPQSLSEGFRHTNGVLGTDCTGAIKVATSQQRSSSL